MRVESTQSEFIPYGLVPAFGFVQETWKNGTMIPAPLDNISNSIQTRHVANPLANALSFGLDDDAETASSEMARLQFDVAPVLANGQPVGLFRRATNLSGTISSQMDPLSANMLVAADTSLSTLVSLLLDTSFLFTLEGPLLSGFVTSADLGNAAARTHYYLLLSQVEIAISRRLRKVYHGRQEEAIQILSPGRQACHVELKEKLEHADAFIDHISAVSFADLVCIAGKDAAFRSIVESEYGKGWRSLYKGLPTFRDEVMHSSRTNSELFQPHKIQDMERRLRSLYEAVQLAAEDKTVP